MVSMLIDDRRTYPDLAAWAEYDLPKVTDNPKVWNAFVRHGQFTRLSAWGVVKWGRDSPLMRIANLDGANGWFNPSQPEWIYVDRFVADAIHANPQDSKVRRYVESTVLHELVHLGDYRDGRHRTDVPEAGKAFEEEAYDGDVDRTGLGHAHAPDAGHDNSGLADLTAVLAAFMSDAHQEPPNGRRWPRGIRNNNPGNIRIGDDWEGLAVVENMTADQREEQSFCVFSEPAYGIRAIGRILRTYQSKGYRSVASMITRWAPESDNNPSDIYVRHVAGKLGVEPEQEFDIAGGDYARRMVESIIEFENGVQPYRDDIVIDGIRKAGYGV